MFKKVLPLSSIIFLRFLGLFLVLPVLSVYALDLPGATPFLVGIIVGGYALTQAIFQLPFGTMSDKIGRKPTILFGLIIFIIGSLICAYSTDIYMLMAGRFLQGAGAIGSVATAMVSDLVEEEKRGKAMAIMGGFIAMSFALAMGLGPILASNFGISTIFFITTVLAVISIIILFTKVPTPPKIRHIYHNDSKLSDILKDNNLLNMIIINTLQKGLMTMAFVLIPIIYTTTLWDGEMGKKEDLWMVYLPAMIAGLIAMGPAAVFGEKKNIPKQIFLISIVLFLASFLILGFTTSSTIFIIGVVLFFVGFNMMEPLVQSMISKFAKVHQKGAALGISNSSAYFATFLGGTFAGIFLSFSDNIFLDFSGRETLTGGVAVIVLLWFIWTALKLQNPTRHSHLYINHDDIDTVKLNALEDEHIAEWYINETENLVVIKYVKDAIEEDALKAQVIKS